VARSIVGTPTTKGEKSAGGLSIPTTNERVHASSDHDAYLLRLHPAQRAGWGFCNERLAA
jgi:hypothetical protein